MKKLREGDYIETKEGLLFHIKGVLHPKDRVIAFLRYFPTEKGERERKNRRFKKIYPLDKRYKYLKKNFPKYIFYSKKIRKKIQAVPLEDIKKIYRPQEKLEEIREKKNLTSIEEKVLNFSNKIVQISGIDPHQIGVSGSILVDLHKSDSDIDLVGYGEEAGWKIHSAIKKMRDKDTDIQPYDEENGLRIAKFRWERTELPLEILAKIEMEKVLHGMVYGKDFFIRLVKDWPDIDSSYNDFEYSPKGVAKIEGLVSDDSDSIFTPNRYVLEESQTLDGNHGKVENITSYRGRFSEQAVQGDKILAYGRIEEVTCRNRKFNRMLLGKPEEYLLPIRKNLKIPKQITEK
ncbi:hypothetical protein AKJ38_02190 [candidate division MSBL1 archaeon SCGC-AAA259I14]|nr:hypothetical protein AKJ38_02190 [candidate division MSBL1 archaeon SCGC-AAA259I14]